MDNSLESDNKKISENFQKGIDKEKFLWYNIKAVSKRDSGNSILKIEQCEEKSNDPWDSFAEHKNLVKKVKKRLKNTLK